MNNNCILIDSSNYAGKLNGVDPFEKDSVESPVCEKPKKPWVWIVHTIKDLTLANALDDDATIILILNCLLEELTTVRLGEIFNRRLLNGKAFVISGGDPRSQAGMAGNLIDTNKYLGWTPLLSEQTISDIPGDLRIFYEELGSIINMKALNRATLMRMSYKYLKNTLINAPLISAKANPSDFRDAAKNKPVLVIASGPSLNKQMETLKEYRDLFQILSVDTAWPILKRHNIEPDFLFAVDPDSEPNWEFDEIGEKIGLVVDAGCGPRVVWSASKNHVWNSGNPQCLMLLSRLGIDIEYLPTGGSVSTTAFNFARNIGGTPIVLIGQDLALTDGLDHAEGYLFKYNESKLKERTDTGFNIPGYNGGTVRTERQLLYYKNWYEATLRSNPDLFVINSTEGGAKIEGAMQIPFRDVCKELRKISIDSKISFLSLPTTGDAMHLKQLKENLSIIIHDVEDYLDVANEGVSLINNSQHHEVISLLEAIDRINAKLLNFEPVARLLVEMFGTVSLEKIRTEVVSSDPAEGYSEVIAKYLKIFQEVKASADKCLSLLDKIGIFYNQLDSKNIYDLAPVESILSENIMNYQH